MDKETGLLRLDRVLFSAVHYPSNYGFIPQTYCDDDDPLDILVLCSAKVETLCLVDAKVIGVMRMIDQGEEDDKIISVANSDKSVSHYSDIEQLPRHVLDQVHRFFADYKKLENKEVQVLQFEGREKAYQIVNDAIEKYRNTFGDKEQKEHPA